MNLQTLSRGKSDVTGISVNKDSMTLPNDELLDSVGFPSCEYDGSTLMR